MPGTSTPLKPKGGAVEGEAVPSELALENTFREQCYILALHATGEFAVDFEPGATGEFQEQLRLLEARATAEPTQQVLRSVHASFRGELRAYQQKGRAHLARMRDDLDGAAQAMSTFAGAFVSNGQDAQQRVAGEMSNLQKVADVGDLGRIRVGVRTAAREIARSYEELNRANALIVAELQHEIRLLHREILTERRIAWTDLESGAWIKRKMDERLDEMLRAAEPFCVIVVLVTNLKRLEAQCGPSVVQAGLQALVKRFYGILGEDGMVVRLAPDQFACVIESDSATAQPVACDLGERLSARYSTQSNGISQSVDFRVTCGIVGYARQGDPTEFRRKLQHMTGPPDSLE
jgi:GGDEF domain-containing protein